MPAHTGDVISPAGSTVNTLPTVNANVGTFQGLTVNAKGQVVSAANQNYAPLASPIFTGNVATTGQIDSQGASAALVFEDRGAVGSPWNWYSSAGAARLYNGQDRITVFNGLVVGAPTGGDKGGGTINAGAVYANNVLLTSDARLKQDIEPLPPCLGFLAAIEPRSFRFAADAPFQWGFLAQDVRAAGMAGVEEDAEGNLSLSYNDLIAVLWHAMQELSAKVSALEVVK
jgi:hypothetical protein